MEFLGNFSITKCNLFHIFILVEASNQDYMLHTASIHSCRKGLGHGKIYFNGTCTVIFLSFFISLWVTPQYVIVDIYIQAAPAQLILKEIDYL